MLNYSDKIQVFLLHFAGGNYYSFQFLKPHFSGIFEACPIELPGRGKRIREDLIFDEKEAVADYLKQIKSLRNGRPYLIYGHSMGASLGLRLTKKLEELGDAPLRLIVSGNAGPGTGDNKCRSQMNEAELKIELRTMGGVPEEVLENKELYDFFIPIMKADFSLLEKSEKNEGNKVDYKLETPITALMGDSEETVDEIENWRNYTTGKCDFQVLSGNHFFIHEHAKRITELFENTYVKDKMSHSY
ncbi:MAG: external thioesterase TEII [Crocinitomix sp.]|jgi:external thioesterase TEII